MIGYELRGRCFRDVLKVAIFHAEVIREKEDNTATGAPALADLDSHQCKGPTPIRAMDRRRLWVYRCHRCSDNEPMSSRCCLETRVLRHMVKASHI